MRLTLFSLALATGTLILVFELLRDDGYGRSMR